MRYLSRLILVGVISTLLVLCADTLFPMTINAQMNRSATFQQFEHGFMLAIGDGVEVFPYNERDRLAFAFSKQDISALKENPIANRPPERDYQPSGDFGKLWSNSPYLMQVLGWAITPPIQYTASTGAASGTDTSLPGTTFWVKTNEASIVAGMADFQGFALLNGDTLRGSQIIWTYILTQDKGISEENCDAQRIQFEPNSYFAIVKGVVGIKCNESVLLVKATAQQKMTIFLFHDYHSIVGTVATPNETNIQTLHNEVLFDGLLSTSGDYSIHLGHDSSQPEPTFQDINQREYYEASNYTLLVVIR